MIGLTHNSLRWILPVALLLNGCDKEENGTCEFKFDESSPDGSIAAGTENCLDEWPQKACSKPALASVTLGIPSSGFTFTKDAKCTDRGYKECGAPGVMYKVCPADMAAEAAAAAEAKADQQAKAVFEVPADAPFLGNGSGTVVVQLFLDVENPYDKGMLEPVRALVSENAQLKVVVRHLPLPFHKDALLAHQAALEAHSQKGNEGFWAFYDLMLANRTKLGREDLVGYATQAGLDAAAFEKALDAGTHAARVEQDMKLAAAAGIKMPPFMLLGERTLKSPASEAEIKAFIEGK